MTAVNTDIQFWETRYQDAQTPWNLESAAPPIIAYFQGREGTRSLPPKGSRVLVPGCGHGHDAALWAEQGYVVTGVDLSPTALGLARERYGLAEGRLSWVKADLFDLPETLDGQFDVVCEHTCFCAISPKRRDDYVAAVARALKTGGQLFGLFWSHLEVGGPPYRVSRGEVFRLFSPWFEIQYLQKTVHSTASRSLEEYWAEMILKQKYGS